MNILGILEPYADTSEYLTLNEITETEKERIKILKERCGTEVWKILGDLLTEHVNEFREKQEQGTHVNKIS